MPALARQWMRNVGFSFICSMMLHATRGDPKCYKLWEDSPAFFQILGCFKHFQYPLPLGMIIPDTSQFWAISSRSQDHPGASRAVGGLSEVDHPLRTLEPRGCSLDTCGNDGGKSWKITSFQYPKVRTNEGFSHQPFGWQIWIYFTGLNILKNHPWAPTLLFLNIFWTEIAQVYVYQG